MGDPDLEPEHALHGELRAVLDRALRLELAPFYKHSSGQIRQMGGRFTNTGPLDIYGVDAIARYQLQRFELGGSYAYSSRRARRRRRSTPPANKLDAWIPPVPGHHGARRAKYMSTALDGGMEVGNYTLVEANVTAQLGDYLAVVRVDDLLDKRPEVRAGYPSTGRVVSLVLQGTWD